MPGAGIFEAALANIKEAKRIRDEGGINSIPFGMPMLDKQIPGVMRGKQYLVTASSGVGKTQLTKFLFVNQPYKFIKENPQLGIKLKILYFALEESKEEFMYTLISNRLKEKYGLIIDTMMLQGLTTTLSDDIISKIEECREYFQELEQSIDVIDTVSGAIDIYEYIRTYATNNGTHHWKQHTYTHGNPDGSITEEVKPLYDYYEPNDEDEFVIAIVDHISLIESKGFKDLHEAMTKLSANMGRKMITKQFNYAFVMVQQQMADTEKAQYTNAGQSIEAKLEPSLNGLANNKETQRDCYFVIGLFAPDRHQIERHLGYNIGVLKDFYRCLMVLKTRLSTPNQRLPLLFNGASNTFYELPKPGTPELENIYETIRNYRRVS